MKREIKSSSNVICYRRNSTIKVLSTNEAFIRQSFVTSSLKTQIRRLDKSGYKIHLCAPIGFMIENPGGKTEYILDLVYLEKRLRELK